MQIEYRAFFNRKKNLNKNGKAPIEIQVYQNGIRKYFNTGILLSTNDWRGADKLTTNPQYNLTIRNKIIELQAYEFKCRALNNNLFEISNFNLLKVKVEKVQEKPKLNFIQFFEQQLNIEKKNIGFLTWGQQTQLLNLFKDFAGNTVKFDELTFELIQGFDYYLKTTRKNGQNTASKRHSQLRKYIILAINHDHLPSNKNPYLKFKIPKVFANKVYLNSEEVLKIEALTFTPEQRLLEMARDMFLFSCYTGLRYSDLNSLKAENFNKTGEGIILKTIAQKTKKDYSVPLYLLFKGKPEKIYEKYAKEDNRRLFYGMTNPKANLYLKVLAPLAKISKELHFHASRHTFGTQMVTKTDITVVQDLMQHSDIKTTMIYLHLSNSERNERLSRIEW